MRPRYEVLISSRVRPPKPSGSLMASKVAAFAPFRVMPSAMEALSGDNTTFARVSAATTRATRSRPKTLEAEMIDRSLLVSARGSSVIWPGSGAVASLQAAARAVRARRYQPGRERMRACRVKVEFDTPITSRPASL